MNSFTVERALRWVKGQQVKGHGSHSIVTWPKAVGMQEERRSYLSMSGAAKEWIYGYYGYVCFDPANFLHV